MLRRITHKQLLELIAFEEIEPPETLKQDFRMAAIRETVFNMQVEAKHRKPVRDFLIPWETDDKPKSSKQTWQEKKAIAYAICMAFSKPAKEL